MGNKPLVSVIIPVYMVEDFLERCVNSVIQQTYSNIEIILVDDGSKDNSGLICDELAKKDNRIVVCHKENGGLSSARNCGVNVSKGDYITFIDSDDYVSEDYVDYLLNLCINNNADISCCDFIKTELSDYDFSSPLEVKETVYSNIEACESLLSDHYLPLVIACAKLYVSSIVKDNPFPLGKTHEDEAVTCKYFYYANKLVLSNRQLYAYYENDNGIMGTQHKYGPKDVEWSMNERIDFFASQKEKKLEKMSRDFYVGYLIDDSLKNNKRSDKKIKDIVKISVVKDGLTFKGWLKIIVYKVLPSLYRYKNNIRN